MRVARIAALLLAAALLSACGSQRAGKGPRAAEPAQSPPQSLPVAGQLVRVGALPEGIAVDPRSGLLAVAVRDPNAIAVLDACSGRLLSRVLIPGHARHLELAGQGGPLLIPSETSGRLLELGLRSRRLASIVVGHLPHDAARVGRRIFVTEEFGHTVAVVEGGRVVQRIGGFVQPGGIVAAGHDVAVVDVGAHRLTLIDAMTLKPIASIAAGAGPTHAVADAAGNVYMVDTGGGALDVFATSPRLSLRTRIPLPGTPYGIAIDPVHRRLWVTLTATDRLVELSLGTATPRPLALYRTARQPNTVAVDPRTGTVFVADAAAGAVQIIRPAR